MAANAPGNCDSFEKAAEFCAMTLNADADDTFDDAAESALACWTSWWKFAEFCASLENSAGLAAIADITAELLASAAKPGSLASARKFGSWTITSNASVCISSGTDVSPSVTSPSPTWLET